MSFWEKLCTGVGLGVIFALGTLVVVAVLSTLIQSAINGNQTAQLVLVVTLIGAGVGGISGLIKL